MKHYFLSFILFISLLQPCNDNTSNEVVVKTMEELNTALKNAKAGSQIVLAMEHGLTLKLNSMDKEVKNAPITLKAETVVVFFRGAILSSLRGEYLVVDGLYFRNGYAPVSGVIRYQIGKDSNPLFILV